MVAPTRIRLRSRCRSSIGTATRRSTATKANPDTMPMRTQTIVAAENQPQSAPLLSASTIGARVMAMSTEPA